MFFSVERLHEILTSYPTPERYWVAFSGGMDSSVLLHAVARLRPQLGSEVRAVHVDHGLHPNSAGWVRHCEPGCAALGVPLDVIRLKVSVPRGESVEACAREARYDAIAKGLDAGDCVLTAHHQDDQAETLLLQLLRGAGPRGLAGMPARRPLGRGALLRPLLQFKRESLRQWAEVEGLSWIKDPTNDETSFDRNYLRHHVAPLLRDRWPGFAATVSRSAEHLLDAVSILDEEAAVGLEACRGSEPTRLSITRLSSLPRARQQWVLRAWVEENGHATPDTRSIERILDDLILARDDAQPLVRWADVEVRRFRDDLWLIDPLPPLPDDTRLEWLVPDDLELPAGLGRLSLQPASREEGLPAAFWREERLAVCFRREGLECRIRGREGHRPLKKVFKEFGVPPWLRDRVPLIFVRNQLVAVGDYCHCEPDFTLKDKKAYRIRWHPPPGLR